MKCKLFVSILLFCICIGANLRAQSDTLTYTVEDNTIKPNLKFHKEAEVLVDHYKHVAGIKISKYYVVLDSLYINPSKGNSKYCILVLSNMGQNGEQDSPFTNLPEGKRLLVVLKHEKGKYVIDYVNENVILNVDYSQSEPFQSIERDSTGFAMKLFAGGINKCTFTFYFKLNDDMFYLKRYNSDCYPDFSKEKKKNRSFNNNIEGRNLQNIRIEGYLQVPEMGK